MIPKCALVRECWRCHRRFIKGEDCNHIRCPHCQANSCYVCRARLENSGQIHFHEGEGPTEERPCPQYSNTREMHQRDVTQAAREVQDRMAEMGIDLSQYSTDGPAGN